MSFRDIIKIVRYFRKRSPLHCIVEKCSITTILSFRKKEVLKACLYSFYKRSVKNRVKSSPKVAANSENVKKIFCTKTEILFNTVLLARDHGYATSRLIGAGMPASTRGRLPNVIFEEFPTRAQTDK